MARPKGKFKRWTTVMKCWHCGKRADGVVAWFSGDETPECLTCAVSQAHVKIHGNLVRIPKSKATSTSLAESTISGNNSFVENKQIRGLI